MPPPASDDTVSSIERDEAAHRPGASTRPGRRRRSWVSRTLVGVVALTLAVFAALTAGGWYYADQLLDYPRHDDAVATEAAAELADDGLPVRTVATDGPLGRYDGVLLDGNSATWALFVHGRGASLIEGAELVDPFVEAGMPVLFTSFRNDDDAPDDPDGFGTFGDREWHDLQAWVDEAQRRGARRLVLVGFSMGGSVVASLLANSPDAAAVSGVVLDSPVVSMHETLELQAADFGVPRPLVGPLLVATKAVASLRAGMDFAALEHGRRWSADAPVLLIHGTGDRTVPDDPTVALARDLGEQATLRNPPGVDHVEYVDADPAAYHAAIRALLREVR